MVSQEFVTFGIDVCGKIIDDLTDNKSFKSSDFIKSLIDASSKLEDKGYKGCNGGVTTIIENTDSEEQSDSEEPNDQDPTPIDEFNKDKLVRAFANGKKFEIFNGTKLDEQLVLLKEIKNNKIDLKRQISSKDKDKIWNEAPICPEFDPDFFRLDLLGNLVIYKDHYCPDDLDNVFAKKFKYHHEHIHSHSNGGQSQMYNIGLLNEQINKSKGKREIYKFSRNEWIQYSRAYGISPKEFLLDLEHNPDLTNIKYGMKFLKGNNGKWQVFPTKDDNKESLLSNIYETFKFCYDKGIRIFLTKITKSENVVLIVCCSVATGMLYGIHLAYEKVNNDLDKEIEESINVKMNMYNIVIEFYKKTMENAIKEFEKTNSLEMFKVVSESMINMNSTYNKLTMEILCEYRQVKSIETIKYKLLYKTKDYKADLDILKKRYQDLYKNIKYENFSEPNKLAITTAFDLTLHSISIGYNCNSFIETKIQDDIKFRDNQSRRETLYFVGGVVVGAIGVLALVFLASSKSDESSNSRDNDRSNNIFSEAENDIITNNTIFKCDDINYEPKIKF